MALCLVRSDSFNGVKGGGAVAFSPASMALAALGRSGHTWMRDIATGAGIGSVERDTSALAFSSTGSMLTLATKKQVRVFDLGAWRELPALPDAKGMSLSVAMADDPAGPLLAAGHLGGTVRVWDVGTRKKIYEIPGHCVFPAVGLSADGSTLATALGRDGSVRLWEARSGKVISVVGNYNGSGTIRRVSFCPTRSVLAIAGPGREIWLWNLATRTPVRIKDAHGKQANDIAFAPDGNLLASVGGDGCLRLWEVPSGALAGEVRAHKSKAWGVSFAVDGAHVASTGGGEVTIWRLRRGSAT